MRDTRNVYFCARSKYQGGCPRVYSQDSRLRWASSSDLASDISRTLCCRSLGQVNAQQRGNTRAVEAAFALE